MEKDVGIKAKKRRPLGPPFQEIELFLLVLPITTGRPVVIASRRAAVSSTDGSLPVAGPVTITPADTGLRPTGCVVLTPADAGVDTGDGVSETCDEAARIGILVIGAHDKIVGAVAVFENLVRCQFVVAHDEVSQTVCDTTRIA